MRTRLALVDPDRLTPREALGALYRLRALLESTGERERQSHAPAWDCLSHSVRAQAPPRPLLAAATVHSHRGMHTGRTARDPPLAPPAYDAPHRTSRARACKVGHNYSWPKA